MLWRYPPVAIGRGAGNALIRFANGHVATVTANGVRKAEPS